MRSNQRRTDPAVVRQQRSRMALRIGRIAGAVAIVGGGLYGGWWLNDTMRVEQWKVEGDAALKQAVTEQLEMMENRDFMHTRPELLRERWLQQMPDMASVEIARRLPDALDVRIQARVPVALWQDEKGELWLFDSEGSAYRTLKRGESPDLPLLRVTREKLADVHELLRLLDAQQLMPATALSEIRAGSSYWQINFSQGVSWKLAFDAERESLTQLAGLMQQPRWKNRNWQVDARLSTRWFIRPARYGGVI